MTNREALWYLIDGLLAGSYSVNNFCDEFSRIYNIEIDYDELTSEERLEFRELSKITGRFSPYEEDQKLYAYNENDVYEKVRSLVKNLQHP